MSSYDLWNTIPAGSAVTRGATDPINSYSSSPNADAASGSRFDLSTVSPAYQYFALVIEQTHNYQLTTLQEFELFCQPASIENFKLYGSPDNSSWTQIHNQSTSANITSSGTEFQITNSGSYQYYGLVVTKNGGYHNVSLAEMKLRVTETVDLSNYYNKTELDPRIAKAKGTLSFSGSSSGTVTLSNGTNASTITTTPTMSNGFGTYHIAGNYSKYLILITFLTIDFDFPMPSPARE